jgi:hypothetical protein
VTTPILSVISCATPEEDDRMRDPRSADPVAADARGPAPGPADQAHDPTFTVARELLGVLPFGARADALARCPALVAQAGGAPPGEAGGERAAAVVVEAIESVRGSVDLPDRHPDPLAPGLVRRMLHVLLATRDLGWPGTDAPLSVRRVAAADLFFDATQTVLADDDWKGPNGVEFALLTALARRICRTPARPAPAGPGEGRARDTGGERLGHLHRVQRPRGL